MVVKKKNLEEPSNKKARAALARKEKQEKFQASGEMDRIISLSNGEYLYLLNPTNGKTHHLRTGSEKYELILTELLNSNHGNNIRNEILEKGFPLPLEVVEVE